MPARWPRVLALTPILTGPAVGGFAFMVDSERLSDPFVPLRLDGEMTRRINAYEQIYLQSERALANGPEAALKIAEAWGEGRRSHRLLPPMPARYGDTSLDGAKAQLVVLANRLSSAVAHDAQQHAAAGDLIGARRRWIAALEPIRTLRYSDYGTVYSFGAKGRNILNAAQRAKVPLGLPSLDDPRRMSELAGWMVRLRARYERRNGAHSAEGVDVVYDVARLRHGRQDRTAIAFARTTLRTRH